MPWSLHFQDGLKAEVAWLWQLVTGATISIAHDVDPNDRRVMRDIFNGLVLGTKFETMAQHLRDELGLVEVFYRVPEEGVGSFWQSENAQKVADDLFAGMKLSASDIIADALSFRDVFVLAMSEYLKWIAQVCTHGLQELVEEIFSEDWSKREDDEPDEATVMQQLLDLVTIEHLVVPHWPEMTAELDKVIEVVLAHPERCSYTRQLVECTLYTEKPRAISDRMSQVLDRLLTLPKFEGGIERDLDNLPED